MAAAPPLPFFPTLDLHLDDSSEAQGSQQRYCLWLPDDACIGDEDDSKDSALESTTSPQSVIEIPDDEMEENHLTPVVVIHDHPHEMETSTPPSPPVASSSYGDDYDSLEFTISPSQPASQRSQRHTKDANGNRIVVPNETTYPDGPHSELNALILLVRRSSAPWIIPDFTSAIPTYSEPVKYNPWDYWQQTEIMGKYLIERGFPVIGTGQSTLVFLIAEDKVAKVALYDRSVDAVEFERHRKQRNLDVLHSRNYPLCFAATAYHQMKPEHDITLWTWGFFEEIYIQERVKPVEVNTDDFSPYPNSEAILEMLDKNKNTKFNQWGLTPDGRLVCYDYY